MVYLNQLSRRITWLKTVVRTMELTGKTTNDQLHSRYVKRFLEELQTFHADLNSIPNADVRISRLKIESLNVQRERVVKALDIIENAPYLAKFRELGGWSLLRDCLNGNTSMVEELTRNASLALEEQASLVKLYTTSNPEKEVVLNASSLSYILDEADSDACIWEVHCDPTVGYNYSGGTFKISRRSIRNFRRFQ